MSEVNLHRRVSPSSFVPFAGEMANIQRLLAALAAKEDGLRGTRFLAPCVRGGEVVLRGGDGLNYSFTPEPEDFEGWGVFEPVDESMAVLVEEANPFLVGEHLKQFKPVRLRLAYRIRGQTWLASPANDSDARQRLGTREPPQVYLVNDGAQFEQVVARWDGSFCWFEEVDRRADPLDAERLREAMLNRTPTAHLAWKGCTPEMRGCYVQARKLKNERQTLRQPSDEQRLRAALAFAGGELRSFSERGDCWEVVWVSPDSADTHTSIVEKDDLTVFSAGICLDGRDREFDLHSLVRVVEQESGDW